MAKIEKRRQAIKLRQQGRSYNEIREIVKVSKSTLSLWLQQYPLNEKQLIRIRKKKYRAIERFRETMKQKRQKRLEGYFNDFKKELPFSERELMIAGHLLYWGEGNKASSHTISVNNNDPTMLKFVLYWMVASLEIPKKKIKVYLHLYKDMNIKKEIKFWSEQLHISIRQFNRPYIKESKKIDIDQKGFGHGTCGLIFHSTKIKERILSDIRCIADYYSKKIEVF